MTNKELNTDNTNHYIICTMNILAFFRNVIAVATLLKLHLTFTGIAKFEINMTILTWVTDKL